MFAARVGLQRVPRTFQLAEGRRSANQTASWRAVSVAAAHGQLR